MNAQFLLDSDGPTREFIAWAQAHFLQPGPTPTDVVTTSVQVVALILAGLAGVLFTAQILHALTYQPRNGDITWHRGIATLHCVTRKRR